MATGNSEGELGHAGFARLMLTVLGFGDDDDE